MSEMEEESKKQPPSAPFVKVEFKYRGEDIRVNNKKVF
jgi:hypothetical protein